MTSDRQRAANQANSRRSTGPKTAEGKAIVRFNGLRHGLLARAAVVLPGEDADAFEDLRNAVHADLAPVGPLEIFHVDRVVNAIWRLWRLERVETALFYWRAYRLRADNLKWNLERVNIDYSVFGTPASPRRTGEQQAFAFAEAECNRDEVLLGCAFDADAKDGDAFGKLSRYEAGLERTLSRSLYELRQLQDQRRNRSAPPVLDATPDQGVTAEL